MDLVRFINGMVDSEQTTVYVIPIIQLAEKLGIPRHLVEMRHLSTHNELPSLANLIVARNEILEWLKINYWIKQYEKLHIEIDNENENEKVEIIKQKKNKKQQEIETIESKVENIFQHYTRTYYNDQSV